MATPIEINIAVAAMKKVSGSIIHAAILQKVPGMFQEQAEGMVNDIQTQLLPVAAKAAIEAVDAQRAKIEAMKGMD